MNHPHLYPLPPKEGEEVLESDIDDKRQEKLSLACPEFFGAACSPQSDPQSKRRADPHTHRLSLAQREFLAAVRRQGSEPVREIWLERRAALSPGRANHPGPCR